MGAFLAPLMTVPFINGGKSRYNKTNHSQSQEHNSNIQGSEDVESNVHWIYIIMAVLVWIVSGTFLAYGVYEWKFNIKNIAENKVIFKAY